MAGEINWLEFRAEVAKTMLPIMYRELSGNSRLVTSRSQEAVAMAVELSKLLERELRR